MLEWAAFAKQDWWPRKTRSLAQAMLIIAGQLFGMKEASISWSSLLTSFTNYLEFSFIITTFAIELRNKDYGN